MSDNSNYGGQNYNGNQNEQSYNGQNYNQTQNGKNYSSNNYNQTQNGKNYSSNNYNQTQNGNNYSSNNYDYIQNGQNNSSNTYNDTRNDMSKNSVNYSDTSHESGYNTYNDADNEYPHPMQYYPPNTSSSSVAYSENGNSHKNLLIGIFVALVAIAAIMSYFVFFSDSDKKTEPTKNQTTAGLVDDLPDDDNTDTSNEVYDDDIDNDNEISEYEEGICTSESYTSKFIGIRYDAPGGCKLIPGDEMEVDEALSNVFYEMQATDISTGATVVLGVEQLPVDGFTNEEYVTAAKRHITTGEGVVAGSVKSGKKYEIAGEEYIDVSYDIEVNGIKVKVDALSRVKGKYAILISVSTLDGKIDDILEGFTEY